MAFKTTTPGRVMLADMVPEDMRDMLNTPMDKKALREFFGKLATDHPDEYVDVMKRMTDLAADVSTEYGRWTSVNLKDLRLPKSVEIYRNHIRKRIHDITQSHSLTPPQKNAAVIAELRKHIEPVSKMLEAEGVKDGNVFAMSSKYGFRGNPAQLTQMLFGDIMMTDNRNKPIPLAMLHGYGEGLTPFEMFTGSYGSRKGYSKVQFATADTGYLAKQVDLFSTGQQVLADDCGTTEGDLVPLSSSAAAGRVLAQDAGPLTAGTLLTEDNARKLRVKEVVVRSPLTCRLPQGVCRKCAGLRPDGKWPQLNAFIGSESARVTTAPTTQSLALSAKHVGVSAKASEAELDGFDEINQFLQVPETFKGAVHSEVDGTVMRVDKAPQGGFDVLVADTKYHVPEGNTPAVKVGDSVYEGDALADGTLNPAMVARYRGIGEGRRYFANKLAEVLEKHGVPGHRSNVDIIARAYINNVRITDPDGVAGYRYGEVVPYDMLQQQWRERTGTRTDTPKALAGQYLEAPVLHYTVGTRLTPAVVQDIQKRGVSAVHAHADRPGFQPYITRAAARSLDEPDWKGKLSGFYLGKAYGDMAARGATDSPGGSPGVFAGLFDPSKLPVVGG